MSVKLSIIVPVYNTESFLEKCLNSIINQDISDWECFLIDDGSTDRSGAICEAFSVKDPRFKVIHKFNSGVSDTRNLGLYLAKGEWIGFVDSDDTIAKNRFSYAIQKAIENDVELVKVSIKQIRKDGSSCDWVTPEGLYDIQDGRILSSPDYDNSSSVACLYKSSLVKKNGLFFRGCDYGEDWLFNVEAYTLAGKMYSIAEALYFYQRHDNSLSTKTLKSSRYIKMLLSLEDVCKKFERNKNWASFKDIVLNNFYERNSTKNLRKNSIDYVLPFVDSSDPEWIKEYNKYADTQINQDVNGEQRFRANQDLLKYHFRGIEKFMPFIDTVHLLVSSESQVPKWINREQVHVITHDQFIDKEMLPTFNSSTIEMFLPKIRCLANRFIYANDDFYYTYSLRDSYYFDGLDKIKTRIEEHPLPIGEPIPVWKQLFMNSYNLINYGTFNVKNLLNCYYVPPHIEQGMLKSVLQEVWDKYHEQMLASCSRFRSPKNLNQYIYTHYAVVHGKFVEGVHSYRNFNSATNPVLVENAVLNPNKDHVIRSFVLNDTGDTENTKVLLRSLAKILPEKSKYEL